MDEHERQAQMTELEVETIALVGQVALVVERAMMLIVETTTVLSSSADEARHEVLAAHYKDLHAETVRLNAAIKAATDKAKHVRDS